MAYVSENKKDNIAMRNDVMILLAQNEIANLIFMHNLLGIKYISDRKLY